MSVAEVPLRSQERGVSNYMVMRACCWFVAIVLGAAQAWATRFTMNPDGVSYLDIGDAYWRGDWHNAINAYWSPLYSWILGFFLKMLKPSPNWEYPVAHLVNFLGYVFALVCFEFFLLCFTHDLKTRGRAPSCTDEPIPEYCWWLLGYSFFLSTSLLMIGLTLVTPDMLVAAFVYLACALVLKIRSGAGRRPSIGLGVILSLAYLSKAIMLPIGIIFLLMAFYRNSSSKSMTNAAIAGMLFLGIASPFVAVLSHAQRHLTFGEVGPIAYEEFVNGDKQFIPSEPGVLHPVRKISNVPIAHEFGSPISGTYPIWYDPAYWHAGLKPHWDARQQWNNAIRPALGLYYAILTTIQLNLLVPLAALVLIATDPLGCCKRMLEYWPFLVPAIGAVVLYSLVYAEPRYLGPFSLLFWMVGFAALRFPGSVAMKKFLAVASAAIAVTSGLFIGNFVVQETLVGWAMAPVYSQAAEALARLGVKPGDRIAVIASEPWGEGGSFVARLARSTIVAQSRDVSSDWMDSTETFARFISALQNEGVKAVLFDRHPPANSSWVRLAQTHYYAYLLAQ
jgi:hypothetical protein